MTSAIDRQGRSFWLKHLHRWHWISSAACLIGMLLFAATGITLNHAAQIEATPVITTRAAVLPADLLPLLRRPPQAQQATLPPVVAQWLEARLALSLSGEAAEWSDDEIYLSLPRPGGDAWLTVDRASGEVAYELTGRGWVSYLNDLHKGRNTGAAWRWFIDVFAGLALVFCITGLLLLHLHAGRRPATWPLVGLGLVVPLVLAILFIH
ncbi:PepSY-associated TM helix domain-containing protein [Chitiniphilus purpureus]|uniref:PepSY-associated TM helix domain-containing protein n=1 Tax=Chitiniphilus purpureus TaxID=2981137 RepID=A0ABY6DMX5_9NEIS|nr:PepSY-associated TM helix domain-containing protein [Chitiniphilus sp. CD1]UXY14846.1 PepSY-associated TM helix domain-containing protein [Chitiniphilus sp. CD1]